MARGWSQTELAHRAGVTRQLVSAVEAGRHVPNVTAALHLARALDLPVEALFSQAEPVVLGDDVLGGTPVLVGRVGDRTVSVPASCAAESWGVVDGVWDETGVDWFPGGTHAGLVIAGCDPIMGTVAGLAGQTGHRVLTVHASTGRSVELLADGRVHGVVVHSRAGDLPAPPAPVRRWHVARWQVGLASADVSASLDELVTTGAAVVQREAGAGAQQALVRALRAGGANAPLPGPVGTGHIDVARRVAYGTGEAGVAMEAAAVAFNLGFTPLEEHDVELWLAEQWVGLPAAGAFLESLRSEGLAHQARLLAGYDRTRCGDELTPAAPPPETTGEVPQPREPGSRADRKE